MSSSMPMSPNFSSPVRGRARSLDDDSIPSSPPMNEFMMYPWNWGVGAQKIQLSPSNSCSSPESERETLRRGRPRSDCISNLMVEGATSPNGIKCRICHRVFPRDKSLQAHMRTHTGKFIKLYLTLKIKDPLF